MGTILGPTLLQECNADQGTGMLITPVLLKSNLALIGRRVTD